MMAGDDEIAPTHQVASKSSDSPTSTWTAERQRLGGGLGFATVALDGDPATELLAAVQTQRELTGNLIGPMRLTELDVTGFEV